MSTADNIHLTWKGRMFLKREGQFMNLSGCVILPDGHLLFADYIGKKQIMKYKQDGTHVQDIPLSGHPYGLALIDQYRVGISYGKDKYIEILKINHALPESKTDAPESCWDISFDRNKLYTVLSDKGILVTFITGKILYTIPVSTVNVGNVTVLNDQFYYTNNATGYIYCRKPNGEKVWSFQDNSIVRPRNLTIDKNQNVYVVGANSRNVTVISSDGKTSKTLLTGINGLDSPNAINYSKELGWLLICNEYRNIGEAYLYKVDVKSNL